MLIGKHGKFTELALQLLVRSGESGYGRIVLGVHCSLDVMARRIARPASAANWWNDPKFRNARLQAGDELRAELEWHTRRPLAEAAPQRAPYRDTLEALADYTDRMHYDFPRLYDNEASMIVPQATPGLLINAFPVLNNDQRADVLRHTALLAGHPLNN